MKRELLAKAMRELAEELEELEAEFDDDDLDLDDDDLDDEVHGMKGFQKGDRIIVEYEPKEYYSGTVTKSTPKNLTVHFDDGDVQTYPRKSKKLLGWGPEKKRKSPIPKAKLKQWLYGSPKQTFSKGDRIVINYEGNPRKPEYYIGTVIRGGNKITVEFDDGDVQTYLVGEPAIIGHGIDKKRKGEIPKDKVKKWLKVM